MGWTARVRVLTGAENVVFGTTFKLGQKQTHLPVKYIYAALNH
jgi:hypothetical protein